ncbi:MAG: hypothetical protein IH948_01670, partial [Bacteroidetes bacterium]|nr:hypothetical protein [Bacteroidota bacterium]
MKAVHLIEVKIDVSTNGTNVYDVFVTYSIGCAKPNQEFEVEIYYRPVSAACATDSGIVKFPVDDPTGTEIIRSCLNSNTDCGSGITEGVLRFTYKGQITLPANSCEYEFFYPSPGERDDVDNMSNQAEKYYTNVFVT